MKWLILALCLVACSGGRFDVSLGTGRDGGVDSAVFEAGPRGLLDSPTGDAARADSSHDSGLSLVSDAGVGMARGDAGTVSTDSGVPHDSSVLSPPDGGTRVRLDSGPPALTCPTDVSHCGGKSWTGNTCQIGYGACCHNALCWCCLGG